MKPQQYQRYHIHLTLNGITEQGLPHYELSRDGYDWLTHYIALTARERVESTVAPDGLSFLWLETVDGLNLMVSEKAIELLRLFTQSSPLPPSEPPDHPPDIDNEEDWGDETATLGRVVIYLRGRPEPIISSTMDYPEKLAQYFLIMDDADTAALYLEYDSEFIFFMDDDGEEVGVRLDQVMLIIAYPGSLDFSFMEIDD